MKTALAAAAALAVAGCATMNGAAPPPAAGSLRTIRYETGPCFGFCPVYTVSVSSDGSGTFEGRQHTAVMGTRSFAVSPAQFAEFEQRLLPYRPAGERRIADPDCGGMTATDLPSVDVTWTGKGPQSHLYAYYGCNMDANRTIFDALRSAPDALPIGQYIGKR